jgi:RNA polymerase sigma-70 factor (ECF subfamily)
MSGGRVGGSVGFPSTHWSLVARAGVDEASARQHALAELLEQYLTPLRAHLLDRWAIRRQDVDDLLHAFLADRVLAENLLARAERRRGRFRTFLLIALDNFTLNHFRASRARKRFPVGGLVTTEGAGPLADRRAQAPAREFDVAWARQVLAQAVEEMRQHCRESARDDVWGVFEGRVLEPTLGADRAVPYAELIARYGFESPAQASNVLVTGNRMFQRFLRAVVGRYERDEGAVEEELTEIRRILASCGSPRRGGPPAV